ncbi:MAG: ABC transporter ATP-binding protein [Ruminococcaceae bacterium]|nr:ABC transporter ATP-binding protein [Oscillospiraceae bacterium]
MFGGPPPFKKFDNGLKKPKSIKEVPSYLGKLIGGFFSRYAYIFKLVWETSPLILFAMAFSSLFNGVTPVLGAFVSAELINSLVDLYHGLDVKSDVLFWISMQFGYLVIQGIVSTLYNAIIRILSEKVVNHIKVKIITKSKDIDLAQFDLPEFYEKLENASREAGFRPVQILSSTFSMLSNIISVISFITVLCVLDWRAPLLIIVFALPAAIIKFVYGRKNFLYMRRHSKERRLMEYYSSVMTNKDIVKEVRLFNLSDIFIDKFQNTFKRYYKGMKRLVIRENIWHIIITIVTAAVNALLFLYIALNVSPNGLTVGDFSLYSGSLNSIIGCVGTLVSTTATIYEGTLFIDNMIAFNKVERKITPILDEPASVQRHTPHTIEFKNVYFAYPGSEKYVLKNINFKLNGGDTAVLVGLNGAGKTTLIKLLTRLYDPSEGVILLDGRDIREYDLDELYSIYGIIFQDFGKYAVQASENICFGDTDKGYNEEDMVRAAIQSGANDFIEQLPKKYDTYLSKFFEDDGTELSIGQWQKLAVARAFYSDSDILILDEPTASLDALAEQQIFNEIDSLRENMTTIFVSHRLSSATRADVIIVLEMGEIVEMGNHNELMALNGKYHELFSAQAERYINYLDKNDK